MFVCTSYTLKTSYGGKGKQLFVHIYKLVQYMMPALVCMCVCCWMDREENVASHENSDIYYYYACVEKKNPPFHGYES